MALISKKFFLRRSGMSGFLDGLENNAVPAAVSVYLPPGLPSVEIEDILGRVGGAGPLPGELAEAAANSRNGAVLFQGGTRLCLVLPPFPVTEKLTAAGCFTAPLRSLLDSNFRIGIVLVHLGSYAVGICRGDRLVDSKVGTGLVHGRHRQGGSSQMRFQRRRENQADEFLDRVCLHAREKLEPEAKLLDYIVYGGPHHTVLLLQKVCPFLRSLDCKVLPLLDVREPRQRVLEATVTRIWSSSIIEWEEEQALTNTLAPPI